MWSLKNTDQLVEVSRKGAVITRWQFQGHDIVKPQPPDSGFLDHLPLFGCFPMVPFCNRLKPFHLKASPLPIPIAINWPSEALAMHGVCFDTEWTCNAQGSDHLDLTCDVVVADGMNVGTCTQHVALRDDGLSLVLAFRSEFEGQMQAGVGFHPWFPAPAQVTFRAQHRLLSDEVLQVQGVEPVDEVQLQSAEHDGHDLCYTGLRSDVLVVHEPWPRDLRIETDAACLHVFLNSDLDCVCVEPVTHAPNAAHNPISAEHSAMTMLSYGESISVEARMRLIEKRDRSS